MLRKGLTFFGNHFLIFISLSLLLLLLFSRNAISISRPPRRALLIITKKTSLFVYKNKNKVEIADARQQADDLDRHAALLLRSAEALEREIGTATRDVARLKASFPALEGQAREAEAKLESFR